MFTFHHNKIWAWEGLAQLLLDAGFYVSAAPIVRSEGKGEVHSSAGNIRYDCVLVCRKRPSAYAEHNWPSLRELILRDAVLWTKRTLKSGMPVNEVDIFTIVMGKTIEHHTRAIANGKHDKEAVTLSEALKEIANVVDLIGTNVATEQPVLPKTYAKRAEQLTLFVMESKAKYEITAREK